jgi:cytochrome bd ubiquinol oxidase subunit I
MFAVLSAWFALSWLFRRDMPRSRWFLRIAAAAGILSVVTMEAGWVVTEVGRQPWIVYNLMTVTDAATENTGVWVTFLVVAAVYVVVGVTTVLVLRLMSRRFRGADAGDDNVPYGPRAAPALSGRDGEA